MDAKILNKSVNYCSVSWYFSLIVYKLDAAVIEQIFETCFYFLMNQILYIDRWPSFDLSQLAKDFWIFILYVPDLSLWKNEEWKADGGVGQHVTLLYKETTKRSNLARLNKYKVRYSFWINSEFWRVEIVFEFDCLQVESFCFKCMSPTNNTVNPKLVP